MPRTAQNYIDLMRHSLGRTPDPAHDLWATLNDAGRAVFNCAEDAPWFHEWSWRARYEVPLTLTAGASVIDLPADFQEVVNVQIPGQLINRVNQQNLLAVSRLSGTNITGSQTIYMAFDSGRTQASTAVLVTPTATIWPPQATTRSDLRITYLAGWTELAQAAPTALPNIPIEWERLLLLTARSMAYKIETQNDSIDSADIPREISRLVGLDAGKQQDIGKPSFSVMLSARRSGFSNNSAGGISQGIVTRP